MWASWGWGSCFLHGCILNILDSASRVVDDWSAFVEGKERWEERGWGDVTCRGWRTLFIHDLALKIETPILSGPVRPGTGCPSCFSFILPSSPSSPLCMLQLYRHLQSCMRCFHFHGAFAYARSQVYHCTYSATCCLLIPGHCPIASLFGSVEIFIFQFKHHFFWEDFCDPLG